MNKAQSNNMGKESITKSHSGKPVAKGFLFKGITVSVLA